MNLKILGLIIGNYHPVSRDAITFFLDSQYSGKLEIFLKMHIDTNLVDPKHCLNKVNMDLHIFP